jgi:hypothetical protein
VTPETSGSSRTRERVNRSRRGRELEPQATAKELQAIIGKLDELYDAVAGGLGCRTSF